MAGTAAASLCFLGLREYTDASFLVRDLLCAMVDELQRQ